jgi:hypothetical protein
MRMQFATLLKCDRCGAVSPQVSPRWPENWTEDAPEGWIAGANIICPDGVPMRELCPVCAALPVLELFRQEVKI